MLLALLVILLLGGTGMAMAGARQQTSLAQLVLQPDDFPGDYVSYYAGKVREDRFLGDPSPVNIPLKTEGFLEAYAVDAFYPVTLRNSGAPSGVFILNIAYQYQDGIQAGQALEQQLEWFKSADIATDTTIEQLNEPIFANTAEIQARAFELTYFQEGRTWSTCWLLGAKGNTLVLLMVDGLPDPAIQEVFSVLATKVIQCQQNR